MAVWSSDEVMVNGVRIHYHRTGGDKPPVVLSHGITDNGLCWTHVARVLESDYDVIMYDARGHGLSEAPPKGYSWEHLADDLVGLIQALALEKPALIGHSMGAETVARAAAARPDLVGRAVLEDPPWRTDLLVSDEERETRREEWRDRVLERKSKTREELMAWCRSELPTWPEAELGPWADAKRQLSLNVFQLFEASWKPWQEAAREITCPTLLVTADPEKDAIVTPDMAQEAVDLLLHGRVVRIRGAGHSIHREQFDAYMEAVTQFLSEA